MTRERLFRVACVVALLVGHTGALGARVECRVLDGVQACDAWCTPVLRGEGLASVRFVVQFDQSLPAEVTEAARTDVVNRLKDSAGAWQTKLTERQQDITLQHHEGSPSPGDVIVIIRNDLTGWEKAEFDHDSRQMTLPREYAIPGALDWPFKNGVYMHEFGHALGFAGVDQACGDPHASVMQRQEPTNYRGLTSCDDLRLNLLYGAPPIRRDNDGDGASPDDPENFDCDDDDSSVTDNCTDEDGDGHYWNDDCDDENPSLWDNCEVNPDPGSPILIDTGGTGFHLTSRTSGVRFDLNGDGMLEQLPWTAPDGDDAWLAFDRNGNGSIDDGTELFGNYTPQPFVDDPHGFLALALFDLAADGGNGDGWIDAQDALYQNLRLWHDSNHNGVSEADELMSLPEAGISALALDYHESRRVDRWGNWFRFHARVIGASVGDVGHVAYDVYLTGRPPRR